MHAFSSVAVVHGWIDGWVDECRHGRKAGQNDGGRKLACLWRRSIIKLTDGCMNQLGLPC
jgi:nitrite reductase/ring-hydroxylating ferredoxin subunit